MLISMLYTAVTPAPSLSKIPFATHYPAIHDTEPESRQVRRAVSRRARKGDHSSISPGERNRAVIDAIGRANRRRQRSGGCRVAQGSVVGVAGQFALGLDEEIRVDLFCGGGGASEGIEIATGEAVTIAVNHDEAAISMHRRNHPKTEHYRSGVHDVCPRAASRGRVVSHLHASPDCTHFSQAKGGQPRDRAIRSLAWIIPRWAGMVRPRMITMENVESMLAWTNLVAKRDPATGRVLKLDRTVAEAGEQVPVNEQFLVPNKKTLGKTFKHFVRQLEAMGYQVQYRVLVAANYGAPTTRERLYLVARCDGMPIVWPKQTHFKQPGRSQKSWRGAHECIDWSIPSQSIFGRKKDLVPATMRRVAKGIQRFVLDAAAPFIVPQANVGVAHQPAGYNPAQALAPVVIHAGHGEGSGATKRRSHGSKHVTDPLGTIVASGGGQALANAKLVQTAFMAQANDGFNQTPGHDLRRPMTTITNKGSCQVPAGYKRAS